MRRIVPVLATCVLLAMPSATVQAIDFGGLINKALDTGKKLQEANREFTPEEEVQLGEGIASGFLGAVPLHPDANLQRYVNRVGRWIASNSERPDLPWSFGVIDTETINAFALPGGTVLVSHGLMKRLQSESELAGVLGHEIAHVVKKHQLNAIQSSASTNIWTDLAKDEAASRAGRGGGVGGVLKSQAARVGVDLAKDGFVLRPLDRGMEFEADKLGIVLAARAGYDPYGLVPVLQTLSQMKSDGSGGSVFDTHPAPTDRLDEIERFVPALDRYASHPTLEARYKQAVK